MRAGGGERLVDPLQALLVAAQASLGDAVEQRERRIFELALVTRAQVLDDGGMMAGGRECASFGDDRRRLIEALDRELI